MGRAGGTGEGRQPQGSRKEMARLCEARIGVLDGGADEGQRIRGGGGLRREPGAFCGVEEWIRPSALGTG
jgi:hypothetical protein